jgi:dethiobiotin synthetase
LKSSASVRGVFVTGTGTEVGKTVVAAVIARTLVVAGERAAIFKPAESGLDEQSARGEEADHELLRRAALSGQNDEEIAPYRFGPPVSPHLGAEMAGARIDAGRLLAGAVAAAEGADVLVSEGVGGWLVPLVGDYLVRDFARELGLPVVIAAAPGLGTINHTLLTVESVRGAGLDVAAVVLTPWPAEVSRVEESNRETLVRLGGVAVETLRLLDLADTSSWPPLQLDL